MKLLLLLVCTLSLQASISPIWSDVVSSDFGVAGTGSYRSDIFVHFAVDQYDAADVPAANLKQALYYRYSYIFASVSADPVESFDEFVISLPGNCGSDAECVFGASSEETQFNTVGIGLHLITGGLTMHGARTGQLQRLQIAGAFS